MHHTTSERRGHQEIFSRSFNSLIENKDEILSEYDELVKRITDSSKEEAEMETIESEKTVDSAKRYRQEKSQEKSDEDFPKNLKKQDSLITAFDEKIWSATLNHVVVRSDKELVFHFKDGRELPWEVKDEE